MSLQALIAVRSHKTVSFLPHLFPVEDEDEPGRRVAGRRAAFHFERLARLVRGSKATEGGSFLGGDRQAHVRLAEDREEIRPLRGHLTPVQPNKVHLHCRVQIVSNYFSKKYFSFLFFFFSRINPWIWIISDRTTIRNSINIVIGTDSSNE